MEQSMWTIILALSFQASALKLGSTGPVAAPTICEAGTLLYPELLGDISKRQPGTFCFDKTFTAIVSENCKQKCALTEKAKADKAPLGYSQNGTPGSWLCTRLGGEARVLFLEHKGVRRKQSFCLTKTEIVSTPYLYGQKGRQ
jgi:hypothetical protein